MSQIFGMHAANEGDMHLASMFQVIRDTGPVTILDKDLGKSAGNGETVYTWLRRTGPKRLIHVRQYDSRWEDVDPRALARRAVSQLGHILMDPYALISPANEQNLEARHPVQTLSHADKLLLYRKIGRWCLDWLDELNKQAPGRRCRTMFPALAAGHDPIKGRPDSEFEVAEIARAVEAFDVLGVHSYAEFPIGKHTAAGKSEQWWYQMRPWRAAGVGGVNDKGGAATRFPHKPVFVSETGTFAHNRASDNADTVASFDAMQRAAKRCIGITPFIWNTDDAHPTNKIIGNWDLVDRLIALPVVEAWTPQESTPMSFSDQVGAIVAKHVPKFHDVRRSLRKHPNENWRYSFIDSRRMSHLVIHHTAGPREQTVSAINDFHIDGRGWAGIGYHFVIRLGEVWYVGDVDTQRAHVGGQNHLGLGLCMTGRYDSNVDPAPEDLAALAGLIRGLDEAYGHKKTLAGHQQMPGQATACPGSRLLSMVNGLRSAAPAPAPSPSPAPAPAPKPNLLTVIAAQARKEMISPFSRDGSSIMKRIFADGYYPVSDEFRVESAGVTYHVQAARRIGFRTPEYRAYYCQSGKWTDIQVAPLP